MYCLLDVGIAKTSILIATLIKGTFTVKVVINLLVSFVNSKMRLL